MTEVSRYRAESNPVQMWVEEHLQRDDAGRGLRTKDMYLVFSEWCKESRFKAWPCVCIDPVHTETRLCQIDADCRNVYLGCCSRVNDETIRIGHHDTAFGVPRNRGRSKSFAGRRRLK